ncbi:tyrosine-type recombinase/integrase [Rubrivivax albus]|uniref:DUF4102 domain-containing protein n=1 Tax=Rubrivivax albus TaxID=2499835 RepID=A0A437K0Y3_9BURK|nr:integrase arm-type DNA-binding domain-containing protein [Rubrivivax albus]RVT53961.1 DUF4102 domain-containing protein [Rubrivivax albus]
MGSGNGGRGVERLTDKAIQAWLKGDRKAGQKLPDGGGLYLVSLPSGGATWQVRYSLGGGAPKTYSVGPYPEKTLAEARKARGTARAQAEQGVDPVALRRLERVEAAAAADDTFEHVAGLWLDKQRPEWSDIHYTKSARALERDVYPALGKLPVAMVTTAAVSAVIEKIQKRGGGRRETAQKILQHVRSVFRYAQAKGMRPDNPAEPVVEIIAAAPKVKHHPALLKFDQLGDVLRRAETSNITPAVRLCHRLIAFTAVRIQNAVAARWSQFDLDAEVPTWTVPRDEMKKSDDREHVHRVVLPAQIVADLKRWRVVQPKNAIYVFPGNQGRDHISRESIEKALRETLELRDLHTAHGWRAAFSTRCKEDSEFTHELVDLCLDHVTKTEVARAYDRGDRLQKRIALMKWWGDRLEQAERGGEVVPLRAAC